MLEISVRNKTDRCVERQVGCHRWIAIRVEWKPALVHEGEHTQRKPDHVDGQQCHHVLFPIHLLLGINSAHSEKETLDWNEKRIEPCFFSRIDFCDILAQRQGNCHGEQEHENDAKNFRVHCAKRLIK